MESAPPTPPEKPRAERIRPELVRLPKITTRRRLARLLLTGLARLLVWLFTRVEVRGLENVPKTGPAVVVANHLGDADAIVGMAITPRQSEFMAKAELYDLPIVGRLLEAYGVIWVHRGQPDRRALRAALQGLAEGRLITLAPEGRESVTGALEEGTNGAAYLALKSGAPVLPVSITGSENKNLYPRLKRLRRIGVTMTVGELFYLESSGSMREDVTRGTDTIMQAIARLLPPEYRGVYREASLSAEE